jgi:hypothetical protein
MAEFRICGQNVQPRNYDRQLTVFAGKRKIAEVVRGT